MALNSIITLERGYNLYLMLSLCGVSVSTLAIAEIKKSDKKRLEDTLCDEKPLFSSVFSY